MWRAPKGTTSTGTTLVSPRAETFPPSPMITWRTVARATSFSRSSAPPNPLITLKEARSISSAPSIVMSR